MKRLLIGLVLASILFGGIAYAAGFSLDTAPYTFFKSNKQEKLVYQVELINLEGQVIGQATLTEESEGVRIQLQASGLSPGKHGFHVHEQAFTGTDFATAGAHFNPTGKKHGHLNPDGPHLGDLGNLEVKEDGTVERELVAKGLTLQHGQSNSIVGRSLIIHADEDDELTDPAGNAGERIAGGNIGS